MRITGVFLVVILFSAFALSFGKAPLQPAEESGKEEDTTDLKDIDDVSAEDEDSDLDDDELSDALDSIDLPSKDTLDEDLAAPKAEKAPKAADPVARLAAPSDSPAAPDQPTPPSNLTPAQNTTQPPAQNTTQPPAQNTTPPPAPAPATPSPTPAQLVLVVSESPCDTQRRLSNGCCNGRLDHLKECCTKKTSCSSGQVPRVFTPPPCKKRKTQDPKQQRCKKNKGLSAYECKLRKLTTCCSRPGEQCCKKCPPRSSFSSSRPSRAASRRRSRSPRFAELQAKTSPVE